MSRGEFHPLPGLANPHVQTIASLLVKGGPLPWPPPRHLIDLPGGDRMVLHDDRPRRWRAGHPVAVVVHGLTGSHRSGGVVRLAWELYRRGVRVIRLDLRGAGAGFHLARTPYHAGCSDDVRAAVERVAELAPGSPIGLAGLSLGGNVVLKLAGEATGRPVANLRRVAALNPPIDLDECTTLLCEPRNRLYEWYFVGELVRAARRRARLFREAPPAFPARLRLREFDDLYTAPRNGFVDVADYYRRSSGGPLIPSIAVPTLVVTARDDPFIAAGAIESIASPYVRVQVSDRGGHTGFLGRGGAWAERVIADWLIGDAAPEGF
jgi:hypothetical protein